MSWRSLYITAKHLLEVHGLRIGSPSGSRVVTCQFPCLLQWVFPLGIPPEVAHIAPIDVNGIQVPMSAQPEGAKKVLVDFYKKCAE